MRLLAAAVQLAAHDRSGFIAAWRGIEAALREALSGGAKIVVLPEGTLPAYVLGSQPFRDEEIAAALERCRELAQQAQSVVIVGAARSAPQGVANSAVVIDADGSIAGAASKHFLWHFDRQWFEPGSAIDPVQTRFGSIGALICADGRIPTIARTLVERGAQVLAMPTAWVTSGRDPRSLENVQADLLARVRARENGVPFIAANKCGVEQRCVAYCGKSQIVDADGTVARIASEDRAEILFSEIEIAEPRAARSVPDTPYHDAPQTPLRIAIAARAEQPEDRQRLAILEAQRFIHAGISSLDDRVVLDPAGLATLRLRGTSLAVWQTQIDPQWQVTFARARALELRMYVVVVDPSRERAFAVDPDGAIVCGTFGEYEIASFAFEPARTQMTVVAPGTDVLEGLTRAAEHAAL